MNLLGSELKHLIVTKFNLDCSNLKIICNGKVIREDTLLSSQDIKVNRVLNNQFKKNSFK